MGIGHRVGGTNLPPTLFAESHNLLNALSTCTFPAVEHIENQGGRGGEGLTLGKQQGEKSSKNPNIYHSCDLGLGFMLLQCNNFKNAGDFFTVFPSLTLK